MPLKRYISKIQLHCQQFSLSVLTTELLFFMLYFPPNNVDIDGIELIFLNTTKMKSVDNFPKWDLAQTLHTP